MNRPAPGPASRTLRTSDRAPGAARDFVHRELEAAGLDPAVTSSAELLVSELVTDSMRQGPAQLTVAVEPSADGGIRVEVASDGVVELDDSASVQRAIARRFVHALADRWQSDLDRTRTSAWFELAGPTPGTNPGAPGAPGARTS